MTIFLYGYRYRATVFAVIFNDCASISKYEYRETVFPVLFIAPPLMSIQSFLFAKVSL